MSLFKARGKPKRIGREDNEAAPVENEEDNGPVVRRPGAPKTKSKLRVSFDPRDADAEDADGATASDSSTSVAKSKSSRAGPSAVLQSRLNQVSTPNDTEGARPSYSKAYLDELRNSTPSTPKELSLTTTPNNELAHPTSLDIESKFGKTSLTSSSHIPSASEIQERKDRRARLAKEQAAEALNTKTNNDDDDFIPLESYDSDGEFKPSRLQVSNYLPSAHSKENTRLLPDDEDIAEGFEAFTEDAGRVTLSKRGLREQSRKEREAMRSMIDNAEGNDQSSDNDDESDSSDERNMAYETAQTHHGMDGLASHAEHRRITKRPRQPGIMTPIPKLATGLGRLREIIQKVEFDRARIEKRVADIAREKQEVKASQEHIQRELETAGAELEGVLAEMRARGTRQNGDASSTTAAAVPGTADIVNGGPSGSGSSGMASAGMERGLESFGGIP